MVMNCKKLFRSFILDDPFSSTTPQGIETLFNDFHRDWQSLLNSNTPEEYDERLSRLRAPKYPKAATRYLENVWLDEHKEQLVGIWTNQLLHLGHTTTSRIEGSHEVAKSYLASSQGDLLSLKQQLDRMWANQNEQFQTNLAQEKVRMNLQLTGQLFDELRGQV